MTAPDLDALVARINALADCSYWATAGWDIPGDATQVIGRLAVQAAAAITELRDKNAATQAFADIELQTCKELRARAERAEAEVAQMQSRQRWRDEAQITHYEGCWRDHYGCAMERIEQTEAERDGWKDSAEVRLAACVEKDKEIAALEAERDKAYKLAEELGEAARLLAHERDALKAERDVLLQAIHLAGMDIPDADARIAALKAERAEAEVARLTERISPDAKAIAESLRQWSDEDVRIASGQLPPLEHRQKTMGYIAARYIEALWLNFERAEARIAALEAERADLIKINNKWAGEWDAMREERDALQKNCTALVQMFELASAIPQMSDEQLRELVANSKAAIDAAKEKP